MFSVVGALGLACQLAVLRLLVDAGTPVGLATAAAVGAAVVHNFLWHHRWTWRERANASRPWLPQLARFAGLNGLVSLIGNVVVTTALADAGAPLVVANLAAVIACGAANFILADRAVFAVVAIGLAGAGQVEAAVLSPETLRSWDEYVRQTEARIAREEPRSAVRSPGADEWRRLRAGEVLIGEHRTTRPGGGAMAIVDGAVHHWVGRVFVPHVKVPALIAGLQGTGWRQWTPAEVQSMRVHRDGDGLRVHMRVERDNVVNVTYDIDHRVRFARHPAGHATSRSTSTRVVQIDHPGTAREHALPEGNDLGFLWRLNAYWRYVPVEGGVLVECESLALSRHVPLVVKGLAGSLIDRVSRESLRDTLGALRAGFGAMARADTR